jgi:hypothetical protein
MKTIYLTFIIRLRLENRHSETSSEKRVSGSVQQVGKPRFYYFDSAEKFQEALRHLASGLSFEEMKDGKTE